MRRIQGKKMLAGALTAAMLSAFALPALGQEEIRPRRPVRPMLCQTEEEADILQFVIPAGEILYFNGEGNLLEPDWSGRPEEPAEPETPPTAPEEPAEPETPPAAPEEPAEPGTPPAAPEEPAEPETPPADSQETEVPETDEFTAYRQEVLELVNAERAKEGLNPLVVLENVTAAANIRAKEIDSVFSHTRPDGSSCFSALEELNAGFRTMGENIAKGHGSPQEVMEGWMNSEGHRKNILNPEFTGLGVGVYRNASGTLCWSQFFVG